MGNELDDGFRTGGLAVRARGFEVVELRRYAMQPGKRDALIDIFEREFIEGQEACGIAPIGHFRDLDNPDSFVWFRGFATMAARRSSLEAFYTSETWLRNRNAANATLVDSDDVPLLRSARPGTGFDVAGLQRPRSGDAAARSNRVVAVAIRWLERPATAAQIEAFERDVLAGIEAVARPLAYCVSEERPNDYPRLPVRTEPALVAAGVCESAPELERWRRALEHAGCETHALSPAARSLIR